MSSINVSKEFQISEIKENCLHFEHENGFYRAIEDGFFYLKIPEFIELNHIDEFAREFYKGNWLPKSIKESMSDLKLGKLQGFFSRNNDQAEQLFIEKNNWSNYLPKPVALQSYQLLSVALIVLKNILKQLSLPEQLLLKGTGYSFTNEGTHTYTFNHYRSTSALRGLNTHKDSGWLTLLRSFDPGLEVCIDNKWHSINPLPDCWIVNFGCAMEIFTRFLSNPVRAVPHRVTQQYNDKRSSYALFIDSTMNKQLSNCLYEYIPEKGLKKFANVDEFLVDIVTNTYTKDGVGLY